MTPHTYQKKPVQIQAALLRETNICRVADWCGGTVVYADGGAPLAILIETLEGTMRADLGDYVIRGVKGEFYPCEPDIFAESYDEVPA